MIRSGSVLKHLSCKLWWLHASSISGHCPKTPRCHWIEAPWIWSCLFFLYCYSIRIHTSSQREIIEWRMSLWMTFLSMAMISMTMMRTSWQFWKQSNSLDWNWIMTNVTSTNQSLDTSMTCQAPHMWLVASKLKKISVPGLWAEARKQALNKVKDMRAIAPSHCNAEILTLVSTDDNNIGLPATLHHISGDKMHAAS